jgi:hypothetical protein
MWIPEAVATKVDAINGANTAGAPGALVVAADFFLGFFFFFFALAGTVAAAWL